MCCVLAIDVVRFIHISSHASSMKGALFKHHDRNYSNTPRDDNNNNEQLKPLSLVQLFIFSLLS